MTTPPAYTSSLDDNFLTPDDVFHFWEALNGVEGQIRALTYEFQFISESANAEALSGQFQHANLYSLHDLGAINQAAEEFLSYIDLVDEDKPHENNELLYQLNLLLPHFFSALIIGAHSLHNAAGESLPFDAHLNNAVEELGWPDKWPQLQALATTAIPLDVIATTLCECKGYHRSQHAIHSPERIWYGYNMTFEPNDANSGAQAPDGLARVPFFH